MSRVLVIGDCNVSREIGDALSAADFPMEYSAGHADALQRLRARSFGVVITDPDSALDEDLALLEEMRAIRPGVKCIVLAHQSAPDEVIAALRARVFACFTPPFDSDEIVHLTKGAASDSRMARRYTGFVGTAGLGVCASKLPTHHSGTSADVCEGA